MLFLRGQVASILCRSWSLRRQMERFCLFAPQTESKTQSLADASSFKQFAFYFTMFGIHGEIPLHSMHNSPSATARFNVACRDMLAFRPLNYLT